jgi:hypothetical protein
MASCTAAGATTWPRPMASTAARNAAAPKVGICQSVAPVRSAGDQARDETGVAHGSQGGEDRLRRGHSGTHDEKKSGRDEAVLLVPRDSDLAVDEGWSSAPAVGPRRAALSRRSPRRPRTRTGRRAAARRREGGCRRPARTGRRLLLLRPSASTPPGAESPRSPRSRRRRRRPAQEAPSSRRAAGSARQDRASDRRATPPAAPAALPTFPATEITTTCPAAGRCPRTAPPSAARLFPPWRRSWFSPLRHRTRRATGMPPLADWPGRSRRTGRQRDPRPGRRLTGGMLQGPRFVHDRFHVDGISHLARFMVRCARASRAGTRKGTSAPAV